MIYLPTGTCYQCDELIPDSHFQPDTPAPKFRFCSDPCEKTYRKQYPKRYKEMTRQLIEAQKSSNQTER